MLDRLAALLPEVVNLVAEAQGGAGLDYLALGDWHRTLSVNARTWYAGTPEADRFNSQEQGQVLPFQGDRGVGASTRRSRSASCRRSTPR